MSDPGWRAGVVEGTLQDGCLQITICTGCFSNALFRIVASTAGCCFWTLPAFMQEGHRKLKPGRARRPFTLISHDVACRGHFNFMLIGWMILCRFLGSRPGSGYGPWRFPLQSPAMTGPVPVTQFRSSFAPGRLSPELLVGAGAHR